MNGLTLAVLVGIVAIIHHGNKPQIIPPGSKKVKLKRGDRVQLGDKLDAACSLDYDGKTAALISKQKGDGPKLGVITHSPPVQRVKQLEEEIVFIASSGKGKLRAARVIRAALP